MHHLFWTSGHNGGVVAVPRCNFSIDCSRPACLSLISTHLDVQQQHEPSLVQGTNTNCLSSHSQQMQMRAELFGCSIYPDYGEYLTFIPSSQKCAINADHRKTTLKCSNTSTYAKEGLLHNSLSPSHGWYEVCVIKASRISSNNLGRGMCHKSF